MTTGDRPVTLITGASSGIGAGLAHACVADHRVGLEGPPSARIDDVHAGRDTVVSAHDRP